MQNPPLVSLIKQSSAAQGFAGMILPARPLLEQEQGVVERRLETHDREWVKTVKVREGRSVELNATKEDLILRSEALRLELDEALPIERASLASSLRKVTTALKEISGEAAEIERERRGMTQAQRRLERQRELIGEYLQELEDRYPKLSIIDLTSLALVRGEQGLPRLSLFSTESATSGILLYGSVSQHWHLSDGERVPFRLPKEVERGLGRVVKIATGTRVTASWSENGFSEVLATATFPIAGRRIPADARKLIREAVASKLFDEVVLLAEVSEWKVSYVSWWDRFPEPKIKGTIQIPPRVDDPLIIGTKLINRRPVSFLLGAFDTTPIENYVRSEFTERVGKRQQS